MSNQTNADIVVGKRIRRDIVHVGWNTDDLQLGKWRSCYI